MLSPITVRYSFRPARRSLATGHAAAGTGTRVTAVTRITARDQGMASV